MAGYVSPSCVWSGGVSPPCGSPLWRARRLRSSGGGAPLRKAGVAHVRERLARAQFTSAEVEALHSDVNSVQATHLELETRILTLEREIKETKQALAALKAR
jgi:hypothetical protein